MGDRRGCDALDLKNKKLLLLLVLAAQYLLLLLLKRILVWKGIEISFEAALVLTAAAIIVLAIIIHIKDGKAYMIDMACAIPFIVLNILLVLSPYAYAGTDPLAVLLLMTIADGISLWICFWASGLT